MAIVYVVCVYTYIHIQCTCVHACTHIHIHTYLLKYKHRLQNQEGKVKRIRGVICCFRQVAVKYGAYKRCSHHT